MSMSETRKRFPVITGWGCRSALGRTPESTLRVLSGQAPAPEPQLPKRLRTTLTLPVFELPDEALPPGPGGRENGLLRATLVEALAAAGLEAAALRGQRVGVAVGTTGKVQFHDFGFCARLRRGEQPDAASLRDFVDGSPAECLQRELGVCGPALTISTACASGADALGVAAGWLLAGSCELAIAAGVDVLSPVALAGFHALGVCSATPCRPFDARRSGLNLGEGVGVLILESPARAAKRGRGDGLFLAGYGKSFDGYHLTRPAPEGRYLEQAIQQALAGAGLTPGEIALVNAHGTGTRLNDAVEAKTLYRVFGVGVRYHSTKGLSGHTLGAAGALEALFCGLMLQSGIAASSRGFEEPDPELPVSPLRHPTALEGRFVLSLSIGFGGSNSALILGRDH